MTAYCMNRADPGIGRKSEPVAAALDQRLTAAKPGAATGLACLAAILAYGCKSFVQ